MRKNIFYILLGFIISIGAVKAQVVYNVTSTSYGPGAGTFKTALTSAMVDVNNGLHAIINFNAPGLITSQINGGGYSETLSILATSMGTLTMRKDPALPPTTLQGFTSPSAGVAKLFSLSNIPTNINPLPPYNGSRFIIDGLTAEKYAEAITYTNNREALITNCKFSDCKKGIHIENSNLMQVSSNTFTETAANNIVLNSGIYVLCNPNQVVISKNIFNIGNSNLAINNYTCICVNTNGASMPSGTGIGIGIRSNTVTAGSYGTSYGIYSCLKPFNDSYNVTDSTNIVGNIFPPAGVLNYPLWIVNPKKESYVDYNKFLNSVNIIIELSPVSLSNIGNYGLDFIGVNSLSMPGKNSNNQFSPGTIFSIFGPAGGVYNIANSINIIGLNLPGKVSVTRAKKVSILQNTMFSNPLPNLPIDLYGTTGTVGNDAIDPPVTPLAVQSYPNILTVNYYLTGNQHISANAPLIVEFFKCNANGDPTSFIGRQTITTVNSSQITANLTLPSYFGSTEKLGMTVTSRGTGATTGLGTSKFNYTVVPTTYTMAPFTGSCVNTPINITAGPNIGGTTFLWNYGDGATGSGVTQTHVYSNPGNYVVSLTVTPSAGSPTVFTQPLTINPCQPPQDCPNCIGSFAPDPGEYMISLWLREDINPQPSTYNNAKVQITFTGDPTVYTLGTNSAKNKVIEGWQRIEEPFTIPFFATHLNLKLVNLGTPDAFFDDIRIYPKDGQMKTYVYDPLTMRLTAMLDENNYATFYEYDEEGKLIRVKKETEKGIMTIQESREGLKKQ